MDPLSTGSAVVNVLVNAVTAIFQIIENAIPNTPQSGPQGNGDWPFME